MSTCFQDLRSDIPHNSRRISYNRDSSWTRRWNILRGYIFHLWLESATNSNLKSIITRQTPSPSTTEKNKKRKIDSCHDNTSTTLHNFRLLSLSIPRQNGKAVSMDSKQSSNMGIQSIAAELVATTTARTTARDKVSPTVYVGGKIGMNNPNNPTINSDYSKDHSLSDTNWTSLRLITPQELHHFVRSYLLIHRHDGVDVLSELTPLEVYSANNLHDLTHCRLSGKSPFFPSDDKIGPVLLHIRPSADCFIDTHAKSYSIGSAPILRLVYKHHRDIWFMARRTL